MNKKCGLDDDTRPLPSQLQKVPFIRHVGIGLTSLVTALCLGGANCDPSLDPSPKQPLTGFVDLHTHPVSNVGFGGKLVYGGVSVGALLPTDPNCKSKVRATSEGQALGHDRAVHGGWDLFNNTCGDSIRELIIHTIQQKLGAGADPPSDAFGFPTFQDWPVWNDITHQKMWVEWIRRSFTYGQRVMVALAVNNKTLGDLVSGPGDLATDDKASADLQIAEIKMLVANNSDFMEIALTADDIARITSIPKLAVVIGVEVDHIGNLQTATWGDVGPIVSVPSSHEVKAEIHRLYDAGVRYIFPVHLLDNAFGGTATYEDLFDVSNTRESGAPWSLKCACPSDKISYSYSRPGVEELVVSLIKLGEAFIPGPGPDCPAGQRNARALTENGIEGIREMMRLGMLIDIDHMSQDAVDQALSLAEAVQPGGYPLNSGHNNVRGSGGAATERALTAKQYARIGALHGMAGVGSSGQDAAAWLALYNQVTTAMGPGAVAGFGTDTNGFGLGMPPRLGPQMPSVKYTDDFPASTDHGKTWNYNTAGVAHYGMLPDFLKDVASLPGGAAVVDNAMTGTEYFYQTWRKAELQSSHVGSQPGVAASVDSCISMPGNSTIACSVFNDGYSDLSTPSDAIYFAGPQRACIPDGTSSGLCRRWFGRCISTSDNVAVTFKAFDDGDGNATASSDAVYNQAPNVVCVPDGTPAGRCRRWFGMPRTVDGRTADCYLFDDGFTDPIGPTHAIYYRGPGQVCMPDGSATGACRKWFGHCRVNN